MKEPSAYQHFLTEREEIFHYKWLESERVGHDIGFEQALFDWGIKHRSAWKEARATEGKNSQLKQYDD